MIFYVIIWQFMSPMLFCVLGIRNFKDPKIKLLSRAADFSVS
jgi:hypothetical protein